MNKYVVSALILSVVSCVAMFLTLTSLDSIALRLLVAILCVTTSVLYFAAKRWDGWLWAFNAVLWLWIAI